MEIKNIEMWRKQKELKHYDAVVDRFANTVHAIFMGNGLTMIQIIGICNKVLSMCREESGKFTEID